MLTFLSFFSFFFSWRGGRDLYNKYNILKKLHAKIKNPRATHKQGLGGRRVHQVGGDNKWDLKKTFSLSSTTSMRESNKRGGGTPIMPFKINRLLRWLIYT